MGFFDFFRRNKNSRSKADAKFSREVRSIIQTFFGGDYRYFVWNYANQIYNIPEVRIAIEKVASIFSRVPIYHKRIGVTGNIEYLEDATNRVLTYQPNPLQNSVQFIKSIVSQLLLDNNVFIEPVFDNQSGKLKQLFPLPYKNFKLSMNDSNTVGYVQFLDNVKNPDKKYNLNDLIYLNRFATINGGSENKIGLYETVLKSLGEQIVNVANPNKPRAIIQSDINGQGNLKDKDKKGATEDIKAGFADTVQGIAYLDKMWKITPINWQENDVNQKIMQMVVNIVYNYFGINENIINDKATEIEMQMFIANTIEPLANQFEKEFTNKLFTVNEFYYGNRIEFDYYALTVSTLQAKTSLFSVAIRQGILNIDECRELIGQPPLPNGWGKKYRVTADTVDIEIADEYQLGKVGKTANDVVSTTDNVEDINIEKEGDNGTA